MTTTSQRATVHAARPTSWRTLWRAAGWAVAVSAVGYCVVQAVHAGTRGAVRPVHPWAVAASVALLTAVLAWGVLVWRGVLALLTPTGEPPPSFGALLRVWAPSSVARYVPGGVWQFIAAGALAPTAGRGRLVGGLAVHTAFSLLAAAVVAAALAPHGADAWWLARLVAAVSATAALVHPTVLGWLLRTARRIPGAGALAWRGRWRDGLRLVGLQVLGWLAYGAAFWLLVHGMADAPTALVGRLTGIAVLAFLAGYAAVLAPAGLGARELALTVLLAPAIGPAAPAVALLGRAWSVAADVALVAVAAATLQRTRQRTHQRTHQRERT